MIAAEEKLARVVRALSDAGIDVLVMSGHAVRHYGIDRNTNDFDLVTALATPEQLREKLRKVPSFGDARSEPVWRSRDFARFEIGRLPDGREEWLEFWLRNHLLDDFSDLKNRAEIGGYGGESIAFLSIDDLMRSKETERESDWQDIALLEEIQDARNFAAADANSVDLLGRLLANVRSRRGMDRIRSTRMLENLDAVTSSIMTCTTLMAYSFLHPLAPNVQPLKLRFPLDAAAAASMRNVDFASVKHFALIEIC